MSTEIGTPEELEAAIEKLHRADEFMNKDKGSENADLIAAEVYKRYKFATDISFGLQPINALPDLEFVVENSHVLTSIDRANAAFVRGFAYRQRNHIGDMECAIADFTAMMDIADASAELRAKALRNRGATYSERKLPGDIDIAIADYTAALAMPDFPVTFRESLQGVLDQLRGMKE